MKGKLAKFFHIFILFIISFIFSFTCYMFHRFSTTIFEQIIFTIFNNVGSTGGGIIKPTIKYVIPFSFFILMFFYFLFYDISFGKIKLKNKKRQLYPFTIFNKHKKKFTLLFFILVFALLLQSFHFYDFLIYSSVNSNFIEKNYVDPKKSEITFEEKRNLIVIFVESLETSLFTKDEGGYWDYDVIPELSNLMDEKDTTSFINKNKSEQMNMISGASWTTASIVSNSTGLPLKVRIGSNNYHSENFMNGSYALGDILKDNGYYNEVISGCTTSFGGVREFFTRHGNYNIIDEDTLGNNDLTTNPEDIGYWGLNDNFLFETAKKRLDIISKQDNPFNLNMITIDTHFIDGFVGNYSETKFGEQYENAYATASRLINEFVNWVREQPYYDNTTIMIVGDHLSMQNDFFDRRNASKRHMYFTIINPKIKKGIVENRIYTSLDTYPTILYSIGANIKGDRLGLGVNLFSNKKTLAERYGLEKLDAKLQEKSKFYNDVILDEDYFFLK